MRHTLKITSRPGNSPAGYRLEVVGKSLHAYGSITRRMDGSTGLTWDGTYLPPADERARVEGVIAEVMTDGVGRTITIGQDAAPARPARDWRSGRGLSLTEEMDRDDTEF